MHSARKAWLGWPLYIGRADMSGKEINHSAFGFRRREGQTACSDVYASIGMGEECSERGDRLRRAISIVIIQ